MSRILALLCLACLVGSISTAQTSAEAPRSVTLRLIAFEGYVTDFAVRGPSGLTRIVARPRVFTRDIEARVVDGYVNFYRYKTTVPAASAGASIAPDAPAGRFRIDPEVRRYLVIIAAVGGVDEARTCSAYAIPDPEGAHPAGYARIINFTTEALAVHLDDKPAIIPAGDSMVFACTVGDDGHVSFQFARKKGEGLWRMQSSTRLAVSEGKRLFVLITPTPPRSEREEAMLAATGAFQVRTVFDN